MPRRSLGSLADGRALGPPEYRNGILERSTAVMSIDSANNNAHRFDMWRELAPLGVFAHLPSYLWLVVGTVCIGAFMAQFDASIAQLMLPELRQQFHEPVSAVAWVTIAYLLVVTVMLPIVGRLADILGRKLLYCCGFLVFVVGSGLCGGAGAGRADRRPGAAGAGPAIRGPGRGLERRAGARRVSDQRTRLALASQARWATIAACTAGDGALPRRCLSAPRAAYTGFCSWTDNVRPSQ
jgi:hypothetical protein